MRQVGEKVDVTEEDESVAKIAENLLLGRVECPRCLRWFDPNECPRTFSSRGICFSCIVDELDRLNDLAQCLVQDTTHMATRRIAGLVLKVAAVFH